MNSKLVVFIQTKYKLLFFKQFFTFLDDVSSISGSDTEKEDNDIDDGNNVAVYRGKIFFQNNDGKVFSMFRSLLHDKKVYSYRK